jgi:hypothetical protein
LGRLGNPFSKKGFQKDSLDLLIKLNNHLNKSIKYIEEKLIDIQPRR